VSRSHTVRLRPSLLTRLSSVLYRRHRIALLLLLAPPLVWLGIVYVGALAALLAQSFFRLDHYTGQVVRSFSFETYAALASRSNLDIVLRTAGMAAAVTIAAALLALPLAYFMTFHATGRFRALLYLAVILPLWSSYLVRVYAWKLILAKEGIVSWIVARTGLGGLLESWLALPFVGGPSLSISTTGIFLAFLYVWLPYMVLPIQAALERVPRSLLEASGDLGATPRTTFLHVTLPLIFPGIVAGSIFTFSLTLGDFIVPSVLGNSSYFIGQAVLSHQGTSGNVPLAAAFTVVPMVIMSLYLLLARRLGAFDAL
jgi:putative spermidine/putrescine transport system permease protein